MRTKPLDVGACRTLVAASGWAAKTVAVASGCTLWTGSTSRSGYGEVSLPGSGTCRAHRVAWVAANGTDVPPGLELDHLCRVRACVNPDHLEPVTRSENVLRGVRKSRITACRYGHPLSQGPSQRRCSVCQRESSRRYWESKRNDPDYRDRQIQLGYSRRRAAGIPPKSKLSDEQVSMIRADMRPHREIAAEYGISRQYVSDLKLNRRRVE